MTKQEFIAKYEGWLSYTRREELKKQMESDLDAFKSQYLKETDDEYKALRIHAVVGQSEQLLDFIQWRKQVSVDDLTDKEIVEFYLARKVK